MSPAAAAAAAVVKLCGQMSRSETRDGDVGAAGAEYAGGDLSVPTFFHVRLEIPNVSVSGLQTLSDVHRVQRELGRV